VDCSGSFGFIKNFIKIMNAQASSEWPGHRSFSWAPTLGKQRNAPLSSEMLKKPSRLARRET
jgi:hypothetical protein